MRVYQLSTRTKLGALVFGIGALLVGGTLLAFGLVLLVGLGVVALIAGGVSALYGRLTGRGPLGFLRHGRTARLDPDREVFVVDESLEVFQRPAEPPQRSLGDPREVWPPDTPR